MPRSDRTRARAGAWPLLFAPFALGGCWILAGAEPGELVDGAAASGGSTTSAGGSGASAGGSGASAGGSGALPATAWPDSPSRYCTDGYVAIQCDSVLGQDGDYLIDPSDFIDDDAGWKDTISGLSWRKPLELGCNWEDALAACDGLGDGWRLPSRLELLSVLDLGRAGGWPEVFGEVYGVVWSSTSSPIDEVKAFYTSADNGGVNVEPKSTVGSARCVRGAPVAVDGPRFEFVGSSVRDALTGLVWEGNLPGSFTTWVDALTHCNDLPLDGWDDWRAPSVKELSSLLDDQSPDEPIPSDFFTLTGVEQYWSSTPFILDPTHVWHVNAKAGGGTYDYAAFPPPEPPPTQWPVRCVRGPDR